MDTLQTQVTNKIVQLIEKAPAGGVFHDAQLSEPEQIGACGPGRFRCSCRKARSK